MRKWRTSYTKEAGADLGFFIENYPAIWEEIKRILVLLAEEDDPRHPENSILQVRMIEHDSPGWWRVYVGEPGPYWVRVLFTLRAMRNGKAIDIEPRATIEEYDAPKTIVITYASFRKDAYGKALRDRFRRYRNN
jgi:hypothetical protein